MKSLYEQLKEMEEQIKTQRPITIKNVSDNQLKCIIPKTKEILNK